MRLYDANTPTIFSNTLSVALLSLLISPLFAYLYALWFDIQHNNMTRFAADALIAPVGIVHGIILLFSN